jgi:hypothetical protein
MIKKWYQFINEGVNLQKEFNITYNELEECFFYITDEFPELEFWIEDSLNSSIIMPNSNSFIVTFNHKDFEIVYNEIVLYYLEPLIYRLIEDVDSQLRKHGLKVFSSDFGSTDCLYELVITKISETPKYRSNYQYLS